MDLSERLDLPEVRDFALRRTIEEFDQFVDSKAFYNLTEKELQVNIEIVDIYLPKAVFLCSYILRIHNVVVFVSVQCKQARQFRQKP